MPLSTSPTMRPGIWHLLYPTRRAVLNRVRNADRGQWARGAQSVVVGALLWAAITWAGLRMLSAFEQYPEIAGPLTLKTLSLALAAGLFLTLVATTVAALGRFFLATDAPLILAAPVDWLDRYLAQLLLSSVQGSWVLGVVIAPLLLSVRLAHGGGWSFLIVALIGAPCIVLTVGAMATVLALGLAALGGARRAKTAMLVTGVLVAGVLLVAVRSSAAGQMLGAAASASPMALMEVLSTPTAPWLPTEWWARALVASPLGVDWSAMGGLLGAALASVTLGAMLYRGLFASVRGRAGARNRVGRSRGTRPSPFWTWAGERWGLGAVQMARKDLRRLVRESSEWSHALLALFGLAIYLINMHAMPLGGTDPMTRVFAEVISLVNIGVGGLVMASLSTFYVFPSLSYEAPGLSLLRGVPLSTTTIIRSKFASSMVVLGPVAVAVSALAGYLLHTGPLFTVLTMALSLGLAIGIVALGLWLGAAYPKFDAKSPGDIASSAGALYFLGTSITLCLWVMATVGPYALTVVGIPVGGAVPPALRSWAGLPEWGKALGLLIGGLSPLAVGYFGLREAARAMRRAFDDPSGGQRGRA